MSLSGRKSFLVFISIMLIVIISVYSCGAVMVSSVTIRSVGTISSVLPLHIVGSQIKNGNNEIVILKGVNQPGFLDTTDGFWSSGADDYFSHYGNWDENVVKNNLQGMQTLGINVVRLTINIDWWLSNYQGTAGNGPSNIVYRDAIIRTIELASSYGLYVDIVPWCVKLSAGQATLPFPPYYGSASDVMPDVNAWINFWLNVSRTLRPYSNVLLELHNEPIGTESDLPVWFNAAEQCINTLRADGDTKIVVLQWGYCAGFTSHNWLTTWYSQNRTLNNVLFSTHIYRYHGTFENNQFSQTDIAFIRNQLANNCAFSAAMNLSAPLWIGEIGAWGKYTEDQGYSDPSVQAAEYDYFNNTLTVLNEWHIGYAVWEWFPEWGSSLGRNYGILSVNWKMTNPLSLPVPGKAGQILVNHITI